MSIRKKDLRNATLQELKAATPNFRRQEVQYFYLQEWQKVGRKIDLVEIKRLEVEGEQ